MSTVVAVVGAGRMGSFFASQIPADTDLLIHSRHPDAARRLADRVGGRACETIRELAPARLIAIAVPAPAVEEVVTGLVGVVRDGTILLNMATAARIPESLRRTRPEVLLIETKVVGHAGSLAMGVPGLVIVECSDAAILDVIRSHLPGYGRVVAGDPDLVERANRISSREAARTAVAVRRQLTEAGIPSDWHDAAIGNVCSGTLRAIVEGDVGHFLRRILDEMKNQCPDGTQDPSGRG
jgi:hypothetical protein